MNCPTCGQPRPMEFWVVKSETNLQEGALAYWGPYKTPEAAHAAVGDADQTIVEVPTPLKR